jgi:tetratricopeptide (TPR) repeat protein
MTLSRQTRRLHWLPLTLALGLSISPLKAQEPTPLFDAARGGQSLSFQQVVQGSYLGHAAELPDTSEPAVVLEKYLEIRKHNSTGRQTLDERVAEWQGFAKQYPESRYAHVGLAATYRERGDLRLAAESFLRANEIGLGQKRILFTREISELMVQLKDPAGLDEAFGSMLAASGKAGARPREQYAVLVDYADGLASLGDERAWDYFEQAIALQPDNIEAFNRYGRHLLEAGKAEEALRVLEAHLTPDQRIRFVRPAFLRRQALWSLGRDTGPADEEITRIREWQIQAGVYVPEKDTGNALTPVTAAFSHTNASDDCRSPEHAQQLQCDGSGTCIYPYVLNISEILYNEARGESLGVQDAIGWTIRNRALQKVSCDSYPGGVESTTCRAKMPCGDPSRCGLSQAYCCAAHGATGTVGAAQAQFNDTHVDLQTLIDTGIFYEGLYVWSGVAPDPTTDFIPKGVSQCNQGCGGICFDGVNFDDPSPNGPMEYKGFNYCAQQQQCKTYKGNVCGNNPQATSCTSGGTGDSYFWNRLN